MIKLKKEDEDKLVRHLAGLADDADNDSVVALFADGESNRPLKIFLEEDWNKSFRENETGKADIGHLLDHIHHEINLKKTRRDSAILARFSSLYARAAAILLLPLIAFGGYFLTRDKFRHDGQEVVSTIYAPQGSRVAFNLPDGTTGMLNSGSYLSYGTPFTGNRDVDLRGEAWFDVSHDKKHPFRVKAGDISLTVLGTSFNVNAYPEEDYVEVVLKEGKVSATHPGQKDQIEINPSERLLFHAGEITKSYADPVKYSAWREGKLMFRGDSMAEVARRLERWYNVRVEIKDKEIESYSFRGTFEDDQLEEVLKYLCMTSPLKYRIMPREILSDGTYSKVTVILSSK